MPMIPNPPAFPASATPVDGWNEAFGSLGYTAPLPPPAPTPVPVPPAGPIALGPVIAAATGLVTLVANARYSLPQTALVKHSINFNGAIIDCAQGMTNFEIVAPDVAFTNIGNVTRCGVLFYPNADNFSVTNATIGDGSPDGAIVQAFKTGTGGTRSKLTDFHVKSKTATVSIFVDEGGIIKAGPNGETLDGLTGKPYVLDENNACVLTDCSDIGVMGGAEYSFRCEIPASGILQHGLILRNCQFSNPLGLNKGDAGFRHFWDILCDGCTFVGELRLGQTPGAGFPATSAFGQYVGNVEIKNCTFIGDGGVQTLVMCYQGVTLNLHDNVFKNMTLPATSADVFSSITAHNNVCTMAPGLAPRLFFAGSSVGKGVLHDNGGNVVNHG